MSRVVAAHGGELVDLVATPERVADIKADMVSLPSWDLTPRQICDLELLMNGSFSPLRGFLGRRDHESVVANMRLADGTLWPMPTSLDVPADVAAAWKTGDRVILRDPEGVALSLLHIEDIWEADKAAEARGVYGTEDDTHAGVAHLMQNTHSHYVGGRIEGLEMPIHYTWLHLRESPRDTRAHFERMGWERVVAFQTRNPLHRAHYEMTLRAAKRVQANLLLHPVVGMTKPGDVSAYARVRCYEAVQRRYPPQSTHLSLLNLAMRMAGPREALWHTIIRKNHGCSHFIVGRDHAGPGNDKDGNPFYGPYDAQEIVNQHAKELGIEVVTFQAVAYVEERGEFMENDDVPEGTTVRNLSGTELRRRLEKGLDIPEWFSFPEVVEELRKEYPPRAKQGFTLFFTGLSGAGKSTLANATQAKLLEIGTRPVTVLDGDLVRKHLSSELGFSKEHRDLNIRRIGFVATEITKNGGAAICAPIAPYAAVRDEVRSMVERHGGFILIHVATPLDVCEGRDRKGLYAKARAGVIKGFTGIDDPYEEPTDAELVIDTSSLTPEEAAQRVFLHLEREGYIV